MASILTHNGTFTISSPTGEHRVFEIKTQSDKSEFAPGKRVLSYKDGYKMKSFAFVDMDAKDINGVKMWNRYKDNDLLKTYITILLFEEHYTNLGMKYEKSVKCRKCNRELTDPESIEGGIGPICITKV